MTTKKKNPAPARLDDTLGTARAKLKAAESEAAEIKKVLGHANHRLDTRPGCALFLREARSNEAIASAKVEIAQATHTRRAALLEIESESGDPDAVSLATLRTSLEADARVVAELTKAINEKRAAMHARLAHATAAAASLATKRAASGEPLPLVPHARIVEAIIARSTMPVQQAILATFGSVSGPQLPFPELPPEERFEAWLGGRAHEIAELESKEHQLRLRQSDLRAAELNVFEAQDRLQKEDERQAANGRAHTERQRAEQRENERRAAEFSKEREAVEARQAKAKAFADSLL